MRRGCVCRGANREQLTNQGQTHYMPLQNRASTLSADCASASPPPISREPSGQMQSGTQTMTSVHATPLQQQASPATSLLHHHNYVHRDPLSAQHETETVSESMEEPLCLHLNDTVCRVRPPRTVNILLNMYKHNILTCNKQDVMAYVSQIDNW
jgi:hypothetical protein